MDTATLVSEQLAEGQRFVDFLKTRNLDFEVAFWVKSSEFGNWLLYIASKIVEDQGIGAAYGAVYDRLSQFGTTWISASDIKLIGVTHPAAIAARALQQRQSNRLPIRYRSPQLGNLFIEEAYIYAA